MSKGYRIEPSGKGEGWAVSAAEEGEEWGDWYFVDDLDAALDYIREQETPKPCPAYIANRAYRYDCRMNMNHDGPHVSFLWKWTG